MDFLPFVAEGVFFQNMHDKYIIYIYIYIRIYTHTYIYIL
jgi:hypothetical protein